MKKIALWVVIFGMTLCPLFARGDSQRRTGDSGLVTVKYLMPGDAPKFYDEVMQTVNTKLGRDKGINIEVVYIPWDVWQQRVNLMLSTGEEFDLYHIMQDQVQMANYAAMGGLTDITGYIDQHGQNIKKVINPGAFDAMKIEGRIYGIPALWAELSAGGIFVVRKDILDRFSLPMPKTPYELLDAAEKAAARWDGSGKLYMPLRGAAAVNPVSAETYALHRTYDTYPFNILDCIAKITADKRVSSWIESEEFKKDAQWFRTAYTKGLINPDILTIQMEQDNQLRASGNWLFLSGTTCYYKEVKRNNNPDLKPEDFFALQFNPEKTTYWYSAVKNLNGVSSTSRHPDAAVKFFDWLYASQDNYSLFMYGRQGIDYTLTPDGRLRDVIKDDIGTVNYTQADWMLGNIQYLKPDSSISKIELDWLYTLDPKSQFFIGSDFSFNSSSVEAEWANVQTEIAAVIAPIYLGVQDYASAFPAALSRLKAAGLDRVLAEYRRQFEAHLASKK
jgi:putative aldouronate transport system substrate-binding protein